MTRDPEVIIKSEAFRALNLLIDQQADTLRSYQMLILDQMKCLGDPPRHGAEPMLCTRTHEENGRQGAPLLFNMTDLGQIETTIADARRTEAMVASLVRFKLRLLNDYDFTHGDASEQIAVFGPDGS